MNAAIRTLMGLTVLAAFCVLGRYVGVAFRKVAHLDENLAFETMVGSLMIILAVIIVFLGNAIGATLFH